MFPRNSLILAVEPDGGCADGLWPNPICLPRARFQCQPCAPRYPSRSCSPCARPGRYCGPADDGLFRHSEAVPRVPGVGYDGEAPCGNDASLFTRCTFVVQISASIDRVLARRHPVKLEDGQHKAEQGQGDANHAVVKEQKVIHWVVLAE